MSVNQLPEKTYERNLNHNYMIIKDEDTSTDYGYQVKMLTDNHIDGLLPVSLHVENGIEYFWYQIQSKQTLERIYERKNISYEELQVIMKSFLQLEKNLQSYLLSYDSVIIDPSFLFMDMEAREVHFVYFPGYCQDARCCFLELIEYLLTKTDHGDERAVMLVYKLYRYSRNDNFILSEIGELLEESPEMQLSNELKEQKIPKSTTLTAVGMESPWSGELGNKDTDSYYHERDQWMQMKNEIKYEVHAQEDRQINSESDKVEESGLSTRALMVVSIIFSMILLGILAADKWLEIIGLTAKTEMFVFAGIIVFAVLGIVFNLMTVARSKTASEKEQGTISIQEPTDHNVRSMPAYQSEPKPVAVQNPIQYRQITPTQTPGSNRYQFFGTAGETIIMDEQQGNHLLRGCDGNHFEYKIEHFPVLIGRMKPYVDVAFDDKSVSKMHAKIEERGGMVFLQDMNSTNGTRKNGEVIAMNESVPLESGDEIIFGKVKMKYCII